MDKNESTAPVFVIQFASLFTLYVVLISSITLLLNIVDIWLVDPIDGPFRYEFASSSIRYGVATLLVFGPLHFSVTYILHKGRTNQAVRFYLTVTRWLVYLSFLLAGGVIAFQLVSVLLSALEGELTVRVLIKGLIIISLVSVAAGYHYLDLRQYWDRQRAKHQLAAIVYGLLLLGIVALGIFSVQTPSEMRERSLDMRQVQDLQEIRWRVVDYVLTEDELPQSIAKLYQRSQDVPIPPNDRPAYIYEIVDAETLRYSLCAWFAYASAKETLPYAPPPSHRGQSREDWAFDAGEHCFELIAHTE